MEAQLCSVTRVYEKSVAFHLAGKYAPAHQGKPNSEGKVSLGAVQKLRRQREGEARAMSSPDVLNRGVARKAR